MKSYYNYLIKKSRNTLLKLISIRGEGSDIQAERILKSCSMEVVETVNIIMILGRDYYDEEVEPVQNPTNVFKSYYDEHWIDNPKLKAGEIAYLVSNRNLAYYLQAGMQALGIQ